MKRTIIFLSLMLSVSSTFAQFHTLRFPQRSNLVTETQRLGVTDITITYSSPALNGRDVWNDTNVIPQEGDPIAWRAGANMNTTIDFSTDVQINGQSLAAGTYGFHVIPKNDSYTLLFAHNSNQWGSYYLNQEEDVTLSINVQAEECASSEKLDYEFINWTENAVTIGLEWGEVRLPFTVSVDLNHTVVASFRDELRGINTYHWQAWNDAANWCLQHNTNLEEALEWANRSIEGGYGGFAADRNINNMSTKIRLEKKLGMESELTSSVEAASQLAMSAYEVNQFTITLLQVGQPEMSLKLSNKYIKEYPDAWYLVLNKAISQYYVNDSKNALKTLAKVVDTAPENFQPRLAEIKTEIEEGRYQVPGSI